MRFTRLTKDELKALKKGDKVLVYHPPFKGFPQGYRFESEVIAVDRVFIKIASRAKFCRKSGFYSFINGRNEQQWSSSQYLAK